MKAGRRPVRPSCRCQALTLTRPAYAVAGGVGSDKNRNIADPARSPPAWLPFGPRDIPVIGPVLLSGQSSPRRHESPRVKALSFRVQTLEQFWNAELAARDGSAQFTHHTDGSFPVWGLPCDERCHVHVTAASRGLRPMLHSRCPSCQQDGAQGMNPYALYQNACRVLRERHVIQCQDSASTRLPVVPPSLQNGVRPWASLTWYLVLVPSPSPQK